MGFGGETAHKSSPRPQLSTTLFSLKKVVRDATASVAPKQSAKIVSGSKCTVTRVR
jgi:hypothetical protein